MAKLKLNQLSAPTFGWLDVNETESEILNWKQIKPEITLPAGTACSRQDLQELQIPRSDDKEINSFFAKEHIIYDVISGASEQPVQVEISESGAEGIVIRAAENTALTVIVDISAENAVLQTLICAEQHAKVKLVQIFDRGETVSDIDAVLADEAGFELVQIYINGGRKISEIDAKLEGRKSEFIANIGYLLTDSDLLDINLKSVQKGRKSVSNIDIKGVLRDHAKKTFRGTIDFRNGAAGAKGAEREDVLLMNETIHNQTVPLILCAEEDVEGSHGASVGRVDERHVFYMQSRGIPLEQIGEIMAQSKLGSVVRKIGRAETIRRVNRALGKEDSDE